MRTLEEFHYHKVSDDVATQMVIVRRKYHILATYLNNTLSESRSKSLALTELENSLMRAIQALAISKGELVPIGD